MKPEIPIKLGLGVAPDTMYIFVGGNDGEEGPIYCWYRLNAENKRVPIFEECLTGYLTNIRGSWQMFKREKEYKVNFHIKGDRPYVLRTGIDTTFSRGLLLGLEMLLEDIRENPISIVARQGREGKVIMCDLMLPQTGQRVWSEWDGDRELYPLVFELQKRLGVSVQTLDTLDDPDSKKNARSNGAGQEPQAEHDRLDEEISKLWTSRDRSTNYESAVFTKFRKPAYQLTIAEKKKVLEGLQKEGAGA